MMNSVYRDLCSKTILTCCLIIASVCSCSKSVDEEGDSGDSGQKATKDCVLGYGMPTGYDIIPAGDMEDLIKEMCSFKEDVDRTENNRSIGITVSKKDMTSYMGEKWLSTGNFDYDLDIKCYRIIDNSTLARYSVRATTSKPSNDEFVITNDSDWFYICDHDNNPYMQNTISNNVKVYFYKTRMETKSAIYNIFPLESPKGYYIYVDDSYGNHLVYFEWRNYTDSWHWYCERFTF